MKQKPTGRPSSSEQTIRDIKRKLRKQYSAEEKIRIVLDGLRGEDSIAELCRREGIALDPVDRRNAELLLSRQTGSLSTTLSRIDCRQIRGVHCERTH